MEHNRSWMFERLYPNRVIREDFVDGVARLLNHAMTFDDYLKSKVIRCPCEKCECTAYEEIEVVRDHLYRRGFWEEFGGWTSNGEIERIDIFIERNDNFIADARAKQKKPRFVPPEYWKEMWNYWRNDPDFLKSEKGKKARASLKGGSQHTAGAISQITVSDRMEKNLGRTIAQDELFMATHLGKEKKSTDENTWVEPRAQKTYKKCTKKMKELCSQDVTPSQEQEAEIWKDCADDPIRGTVYGLPGKIFQEKDPSLYCTPSFGIDSTTRASLEEKIAALTKELATKDEEVKKMQEENDMKFQQVQSQLNMIFQSGAVIPSCPSDRRRRQPSPDDAYTTEEEELGEEDEEVPPSMRR